MKGHLIIIEGGDGSGKATQTELLRRHLADDGKSVKAVSYPDYDSESSALVKMYLRGDFGTDADTINPYAASANHKNSFLEPNIPKEWLRTIARHYKKKTGKDLKIITIHGFRHTHASLLYLSGINLKEAQERLGHSNVKTTLNVYTHLSDKQREQTVDKLTEFMNLN